ncbi:hypothetical protein [Wolbachia endosymbiont (group A) of Rhinocyllus conicus]|uniref:hypothetical protein n=1 Tax=Wolbachia endosymbiont (group A) of Rhinocyllus conicus TaxID=2954053 RepID=UPI002227DAC7|nr:hypothetical protein [Wolbachia endosymbiont (group A) of Rhinocyllus conicus]
MAKRQPSSRYVLAAKRYRGGMTVRGGMTITSSSRYLLAPRRYDVFLGSAIGYLISPSFQSLYT